MNNDAVTLGILLACETALGFSAFEPSPVTCRHLATNPIAVQTIRIGEALAAGFAVTVGIAASASVHSPVPFVFAVIGAGFMLAVYEWAIANPEVVNETVA
jgi:hypothetical protein